MTAVALPCFDSHLFIDEVQRNTTLVIVDMIAALFLHLRQRFPLACRVGVLCSPLLHDRRLFDRYGANAGIDVLGIGVSGTDRDTLGAACDALVAQGADVLLPGSTASALSQHQLGELPVPVVDAHAVYAHHLLRADHCKPAHAITLGVVTRGVKAGFTNGECVDEFMAAPESLLMQDIEVVLLACTELPLLFPQAATVTRKGRRACLVDPTDILAKCCVEFARGKPLDTQSSARQEEGPVEYAAFAKPLESGAAFNAELI